MLIKLILTAMALLVVGLIWMPAEKPWDRIKRGETVDVSLPDPTWEAWLNKNAPGWREKLLNGEVINIPADGGPATSAPGHSLSVITFSGAPGR